MAGAGLGTVLYHDLWKDADGTAALDDLQDIVEAAEMVEFSVVEKPGVIGAGDGVVLLRIERQGFIRKVPCRKAVELCQRRRMVSKEIQPVDIEFMGDQFPVLALAFEIGFFVWKDRDDADGDHTFFECRQDLLVLELIDSAGGSTQFDRNFMKMVDADFAPTFTLQLLRKDMGIALEMADDLEGLSMPLGQFAYRLYQSAGAYDGEDCSAIVKVDRIDGE